MTFLHTIYHFLGGVKFALILITTVTLFVIAGTIIESATESHRYAALFTYNNPLFAFLLWGFFVNILFSAMRRWPFQIKHIPFLITHLGLLMILGGALTKHYFGVQGTMTLIEGSGSQEISQNGTYAIHVEKRGDNGLINSSRYELKKTFSGDFKPIITTENGLWLRLLDYTPHSTEQFQTWIKGDKAFILGLHPIPVHEFDGEIVQLSGQVEFSPSSPWLIYATRTDNVEEVTKQIHEQYPKRQHPSLAIIEDGEKSIHLIAFNTQGHTWKKMFQKSLPETMIVYDDGFKGYTATAELPFDNNSPISLETFITPLHTKESPSTNLEKNFPKITLHAKKNKQAQSISLVYDPSATGMKWPVLNGEFLLRFQPLFLEIPYRVRLRNARNINYANSQQAFSYECDLIITDLSNGTTTEKTISMNHVHETWDGYRFYLSSVSPQNESAIKRIQIIVNYDPGKYWLTYPGAIILSFGIILLFWLRPYHKARKSS